MKEKRYPVTTANVTMNSDGTLSAELDPNYFVYKKYFGSTRYSEDDAVYYGKILGIDDLVNYESNSIEGLKYEFEKAVDDYLKTCSSINKIPDFPIPYKTPTDNNIDDYYDIYEFLYDEYVEDEDEDPIELLWCFISQHKSNFFEETCLVKVEIDYDGSLYSASSIENLNLGKISVSKTLVKLTSDVDDIVKLHFEKNNDLKKVRLRNIGVSYFPSQRLVDYIKGNNKA